MIRSIIYVIIAFLIMIVGMDWSDDHNINHYITTVYNWWYYGLSIIFLVLAIRRGRLWLERRREV